MPPKPDVKEANIQQALKKFRKQGLTEKLVEEYWVTFSCFDLNGDGRLCPKELDAAFRKLGQVVPMVDIEKMVAEADTNKDGFIDFLEFVDMMLRKVSKDASLTEAELKQLFDVFDVDRSGQITAKELKSVMVKLGYTLTDGDVQEMVRIADKNGDGNISFEEFKALLKTVDNSKKNK